MGRQPLVLSQSFVISICILLPPPPPPSSLNRIDNLQKWLGEITGGPTSVRRPWTPRTENTRRDYLRRQLSSSLSLWILRARPRTTTDCWTELVMILTDLRV